VGIVEIIVNDYSNIERFKEIVANALDYDIEVWDIRELHSDIFGWLDLLDMNVNVIIIIMIVVALINIITILLIRILEKTTAIGILKSIGTSNAQIRKIFVFVSVKILVKGMLIGNFIGFGLSFIQKYFRIISLNQETYYVSSVPVYFDFYYLLVVNLLVLLLGLITMILPSILISRIYPAQTLRLK
jgi:lipoprotein-releasing system permease protein